MLLVFLAAEVALSCLHDPSQTVESGNHDSEVLTASWKLCKGYGSAFSKLPEQPPHSAHRAHTQLRGSRVARVSHACLMSSFTLVFRNMRLNESPIHTSSQAACHLFVAALKASFYLLILYMHLFLCPRVSLKWLIWGSVLSLLKERTFLRTESLPLCVLSRTVAEP